MANVPDTGGGTPATGPWLAQVSNALQHIQYGADGSRRNAFGNAIGENPAHPTASMVILPTGEGKYLDANGFEVPYPGVAPGGAQWNAEQGRLAHLAAPPTNVAGNDFVHLGTPPPLGAPPAPPAPWNPSVAVGTQWTPGMAALGSAGAAQATSGMAGLGAAAAAQHPFVQSLAHAIAQHLFGSALTGGGITSPAFGSLFKAGRKPPHPI